MVVSKLLNTKFYQISVSNVVCMDMQWTFVPKLRRLHRWRSQVALDWSWRSRVLKRM
ncbi:hypothetical protein Gorai_021106 [Gossypium raimondii]|uniref:Uncharacterized protein n=1 Tax=Gossypium raimondii TaxID=29730 RepID=A0A7J8NPC0_GOSRA|nr:hypothetical protein [Gossypium raimondii]